MGKKDKKKGKGAEKTAMKTEKKALNRLKKDLASKGEDNIENLIAGFQEEAAKQSFVGEELCSQPTPRSGFSFVAHPDKDELILFGGECFNGSTTVMYNDLYFYNIKKSQWTIMHCPSKPPPRSSFQSAVVSQRGGQLWIFGGEYAYPTRSNFHHYKDLWVFHFSEKIWEQIKTPGGPPARSGHRMVAFRKQLIIFGGFHESVSDYKYFNDVHIFDLDTYNWSKIEPGGKGPSPRSGCQMAALTDGRILVYGGYSREKVKKDVDKGITHTDMFYLQLDERTKPAKWKWVHTKPSGIQPSARCGFSFTVATNNHAYAFGGVHDDDPDDENLISVFYNDLYLLELDKGRWLPLSVQVKDSNDTKKRRRRAKETGESEEYDEETEVMESLENATISDTVPLSTTTYEDGVFSVKIGPQTSSSFIDTTACSSVEKMCSSAFQPKSRMNAGIAIKHGVLYLYGGLYEEGHRQLILSDFYSLDIHKLDGWQTIVPFTSNALEWVDSEESDSDSDSDSDDIEMDESDSNEECEEYMDVA